MARGLISIVLLLGAAAFAQEPPPAPPSTPPPAPSSADDKLYDEVRNVLALDRDVRGAAIEVIIKDGAVLLRGRVRDEKAREKAPKIVKKIDGVTTVTSELKLFTDK